MPNDGVRSSPNGHLTPLTRPRLHYCPLIGHLAGPVYNWKEWDLAWAWHWLPVDYNYNSSSLPGKKNILSGEPHHFSRTLIRGMVLLNGDEARHLLENTYLHLIRKSWFLYSLKTFICIQWRRESQRIYRYVLHTRSLWRDAIQWHWPSIVIPTLLLTIVVCFVLLENSGYCSVTKIDKYLNISTILPLYPTFCCSQQNNRSYGIKELTFTARLKGTFKVFLK